MAKGKLKDYVSAFSSVIQGCELGRNRSVFCVLLIKVCSSSAGMALSRQYSLERNTIILKALWREDKEGG